MRGTVQFSGTLISREPKVVGFRHKWKIGRSPLSTRTENHYE